MDVPLGLPYRTLDLTLLFYVELMKTAVSSEEDCSSRGKSVDDNTESYLLYGEYAKLTMFGTEFEGR